MTALDLIAGLPNLYWLQVLGPRWVGRLGRDRIASTPAHLVTEIAPDHRRIQLGPSLRSVVDDFAAFTASGFPFAHRRRTESVT